MAKRMRTTCFKRLARKFAIEGQQTCTAFKIGKFKLFIFFDSKIQSSGIYCFWQNFWGKFVNRNKTNE